MTLQGLREVEAPVPRSEIKGDDDANEMEEQLVKMYEKCNGDLDAIFKELNEDPGKAKKYPPKDAEDFASKYRNGSYSYISRGGKAEAK